MQVTDLSQTFANLAVLLTVSYCIGFLRWRRFCFVSELARIRAGEISEQGYVVIHKEVPIRVIKKVLIPIKEYPKVNSGFLAQCLLRLLMSENDILFPDKFCWTASRSERPDSQDASG